MLHELKQAEFGRVDRLFHGHRQYLPVGAIVAGNFPGRIFVDDSERPTVALVWALSRWAYIAGDSEKHGLIEALGNLARDTVIPDSLSINQRWFELYTPDSQSWTKTVEASLKPLRPEGHRETVYTFDQGLYRNFRAGYTFPPGVSLETADCPILRSSVNRASFIGPDYFHKTAIGFQVIRSNQIVSLCRSNGFTLEQDFMIDVETFGAENRSRGYATAASVALLDHCLKDGLNPLWETTQDNTASRKLAARLGFVADESYPVWAIEF